MRYIPVLFLLLFSLQTQLLAQSEEPPKIWKVTTESDKVYTGKLLETSNTSITLELEEGTVITINRDKIVKMRKLEQQELKTYKPDTVLKSDWLPINRHRASTNAYTLPKNYGYYENTGVFTNRVNYGLTDNLEIEGGVIPVLFVIYPYWLKLKSSISLEPERVTLGLEAGIFGTAIVGEAETSSLVNFISGKVTIGPRHRNFTVGYLSVGLFGNPNQNSVTGLDIEYQRLEALTLAGMIDLSDKWSIYAETFLPLLGEFAFTNLGFRLRADEVSWDFGAAGIFVDGFFVPGPSISLRVPFN